MEVGGIEGRFGGWVGWEVCGLRPRVGNWVGREVGLGTGWDGRYVG